MLIYNFEPDKIFMAANTGRVYHPAPPNYGDIGLIRSKLAIELSKNFEFENGEDKSPTHFNWSGVKYNLYNSWIKNTIKENQLI